MIKKLFKGLLTAAACAVMTVTGAAVGASADVVYPPNIVSPRASHGTSAKNITVSWGSAKNKRVYQYIVQRKEYKGKWTSLAVLPNTTNKYVDKSTAENVKYYEYRILCKYVSGSKFYISPSSKAGVAPGWKKLGITLDPGHFLNCNNNFYQSGAAGSYKYSEGTQMLKLGHFLKDELSKNGYTTVKITRQLDLTKDVFSDGVYNENVTKGMSKCLESRGKYAKGTDFFISLHTNAISHWNETSRWGVIAFPNVLCMKDKTALELAADIGEAANKTISPNGKTIQSRIKFNRSLATYSNCGLISYYLNGKIYYTVLDGADIVGVPGMLIEHSFHTNPAVRAWMLSDANLKKLAKAESDAILKHYGFPV